MTTVCIVQARAGSSRLPGKVLEPISGVSMLGKVLTRLSRAQSIDVLIVATTTDAGDDAVEAEAERFGAIVVRGSVFDVLDRYHSALEAAPDADIVVRVTADCPFVDPDVVDLLVRTLREEGADFVANRLPPPYPRTYPIGLDVEVSTAAALETAWRDAASAHEREHVMPYLYESGNFDVRVVDLPEDLSAYRWTVDTPADLAAVRAIDALCGPEPFGWEHVLEVVMANPEVLAINADSAQKSVFDVDSRWEAGPDQSAPR